MILLSLPLASAISALSAVRGEPACLPDRAGDAHRALVAERRAP